MANKLGGETSPYLLQHADNPVDWYPWGPEALERARHEDKPILLSIGYAACHWCHVMAHESFEDEETARLMNELFVNIKVDREERPDIDSIYMQAVQAMTGQGGWPMTMFLTPEAVPFYGGTYFPPDDRHGIPSFRRILSTVATAWREQRGRVAETVDALRKLYRESGNVMTTGSHPDVHTLDLAFRALSRRYDFTNAGFDGAPKFPPTMTLEFLLRFWRRAGNDEALRMAHETFVRMARGGMYDQLGGGFARYSVDAKWLVPHFEKMLYDNALLIRLGARLYRATRDAEVRRVTEQTIEWARREMLSPEGGFYSSYDADSEGEEGLFYIWSAAELESIVGEDAKIVMDYFGVTPEGNFEGQNILNRRFSDDVAAARHQITPDELAGIVATARAKLLEVRRARVWPGRDDKIIASWNGLMARALIEAGEAFNNPDCAAMGVQCATFLFTRMSRSERSGDGKTITRVSRTFSRAEARIPGFLEDHAALGLAAIAAYENTFDEQWLVRAHAIVDSCLSFFWAGDGEVRGDAAVNGSFHDTASDGEPLITRPRDVTDNAIPSGTSLATELLLLAGEHLGEPSFVERAGKTIASLSESVVRYPTAFGHMLCAADTLVFGTLQVALVAPTGRSAALAEMRRGADELFIPSRLLAGGEEGKSKLPMLHGKTAGAGKVTAYVCRRYLCDAPVDSPDALREGIENALTSTAANGTRGAEIS